MVRHGTAGALTRGREGRGRASKEGSKRAHQRGGRVGGTPAGREGRPAYPTLHLARTQSHAAALRRLVWRHFEPLFFTFGAFAACGPDGSWRMDKRSFRAVCASCGLRETMTAAEAEEIFMLVQARYSARHGGPGAAPCYDLHLFLHALLHVAQRRAVRQVKTPHAHRLRTARAPLAHRTHTTRTLCAHCTHTACTPHAHCMRTACTRHKHRMQTAHAHAHTPRCMRTARAHAGAAPA